MALVATKIRFSGDYRYGPAGQAELLCNGAFDTSYPTGGEVFDVSTWFDTVDSVIAIPSDLAAEGLVGDRMFAHDRGTAAAGLVLAYDEDNTSGIYAQVADMTDLAAVYTAGVRFRVTGVMKANYSV